MAKSHEDKQSADNIDNVDNRLDAVLISALRQNFKIQKGCHTDRSEILDFLRGVVKQHSDLEFALHHRDTKLSGRIYKAFPSVTTKRVAIPNERGKKVWRYTNLKQITGKKVSEASVTSDQSYGEAVTIKQETDEGPTSCEPKKCTRKAQMNVNRNSESENNSSEKTNSDDSAVPQSGPENVDHYATLDSLNKEPESDLGQFNNMLKWIKEHYVMDKKSSVQVKNIVNGIKEEFHTNITYKQSHKLVFAVFPGASSRVANPVRLEVRGSFYSYRGIAPKSAHKPVSEPAGTHLKASKPSPKSRVKPVKSVCATQTWIPPCGIADNAKRRVKQPKQTRKRFLESCSMLKDNLDPLGASLRSYEVPPAVSDVAAMERENAWQRMVDELKQERDQAIVERNQAMISLMELERDQLSESRCSGDAVRQRTVSQDGAQSVGEQTPLSTGNSEKNVKESRDWLQSLIHRSNHILGEQMSEANSMYFPGSTLQNSANPRQAKQPRYSGDFIELERFESLKNERDLLWKTCMEKMRREKEDVIQQLKLEKMEVIQKMELEKSDAIDCVEEKLTNQITILTRELREVKELLSHTMDERTMAIKHAQKLMDLVSEKNLKEAGLDSFPFDVEDHVVHLPRQKSTDETESQNVSLPATKGNKRKQSVPAKLKKNLRTDSSPVSNNSEKYLMDSGDQSLACRDGQAISEKGKVSSIDYLNSMVESIGRQSPGISPKKNSSKLHEEYAV